MSLNRADVEVQMRHDSSGGDRGVPRVFLSGMAGREVPTARAVKTPRNRRRSLMTRRAGAIDGVAVLRSLRLRNRGGTRGRPQPEDRIGVLIRICEAVQFDLDPALVVAVMPHPSRDPAVLAPRLLRRRALRSANHAAHAPKIVGRPPPVRELVQDRRPAPQPKDAGRRRHRGQVHRGATLGAAIVAHPTEPGRRLGAAALKQAPEARNSIGGAAMLGGRLPATVLHMPSIVGPVMVLVGVAPPIAAHHLLADVPRTGHVATVGMVMSTPVMTGTDSAVVLRQGAVGTIGTGKGEENSHAIVRCVGVGMGVALAGDTFLSARPPQRHREDKERTYNLQHRSCFDVEGSRLNVRCFLPCVSVVSSFSSRAGW